MKRAIHDIRVWLARTNTWIYNQVIALDDGWEACVVANRSANRDEFPYPRVYSLREHVGQLRWTLEMALRRTRLTAHAPSIARHCDSLQAELLHSHFGTTGWYNIALARRLGVPHIVTFYGFDVTQVPRRRGWRSRYRQLFREVDCVLCEGPHMAQEVEKLGCNADKIRVQRLGVRLTDLPWRARTPNGDATRFLMAGSFREKKGFVDGLLALGMLAQSNPDDAWTLTIVGGAGDDAESKAIDDRLRVIARESGIADRIHWRGFLSHAELIETAAQHDLFLCPSVTAASGDTEGGAPVVMIEMAAMGLPIVATRHCDMPQVVAEGNRELLVAERDPQALHACMVDLLTHRDTWASLGTDNRQHCTSQFDHRVQGKALARIYDQVAG